MKASEVKRVTVRPPDGASGVPCPGQVTHGEAATKRGAGAATVKIGARLVGNTAGQAKRLPCGVVRGGFGWSQRFSASNVLSAFSTSSVVLSGPKE